MTEAVARIMAEVQRLSTEEYLLVLNGLTDLLTTPEQEKIWDAELWGRIVLLDSEARGGIPAEALFARLRAERRTIGM